MAAVAATSREKVHAFIAAKNTAGRLYSRFSVVLILVNIAAFVVGTLYIPKYYDPAFVPFPCGATCDAIWFGNSAENSLAWLNIGATSALEIVTVLLFSGELVARLWTADLEKDAYRGVVGRIRLLLTFDCLVDLASLIPFYADSFLLRETDVYASQALRMFRLFRMLRIDSRFDFALCLLDDVLIEQRALLGTAAFVGGTIWLVCSSLYYLFERRNTDMIYCGAAPDYCGEEGAIDTSLCTFDAFGFADCSAAGCPPTDEYPEPCYSLFRSVPMASYLTLLNLFGEYPMISNHSPLGMVFGTIVALIAVAFFGIPASIIGSGFEDIISRRKDEMMEVKHRSAAVDVLEEEEQREEEEHAFVAHDEESSLSARLYNFLHAQTGFWSIFFEYYTLALAVASAFAYMLDTMESKESNSNLHAFFGQLEMVTSLVFTTEYALKVYSIVENPTYGGNGDVMGRITYMKEFSALVDLASFLPFWIGYSTTIDGILTGAIRFIFPSAPSLGSTTQCLRLLRLLKFERYTKAFTTFDDIVRENIDVLAVSGFTATIMWVFFSSVLYFTERDNPDAETASYYSTVPRSMWITLLNLSGESPLSNYSTAGKIVTAMIGLVASGLFGIPIGVLGGGFEELADEEEEGEVDDEDEGDDQYEGAADDMCKPFEKKCFQVVNGVGSKAADIFELVTYTFIVASVALGIVQTVPGYESFMQEFDVVVVLFFAAEYILRLIGAPADPAFATDASMLGGLKARLRFACSLFSVIDLLAIIPFFYASAFPGSWIDRHDEYLRMLRLFRLLKLEKYFPSLTLIDDVFRLKKQKLIKTVFAAGTLWIFFTSLLFLAESEDTSNGIDPVPLYGCGMYDDEANVRKKRFFLGIGQGKKKVASNEMDCTMSDRFTNFFDSFVYTGIHLTGDYPLIEYNALGRIINFFIVVAAVGVVSIPAGLIASGFSEIVEGRVERKKSRRKSLAKRGNAGDDWYELRYAELQGQDPPDSRFGPACDDLQYAVHNFLNGDSGTSLAFRWIMATVTCGNVLAVVLESIPEVALYLDREVDFDGIGTFEIGSVAFFTAEYLLRLFSAPKNVQALYSPWTYATTFFGLVDLISILPWFVYMYLRAFGHVESGSEITDVFSILRVFRVLQIEGLWGVAFSKLDNVFRASKEVLKASALMAMIVWIGCAALFYIFEENNPNFRECDSSVPLFGTDEKPGCFDFASTADCNEFYPGKCTQTAFADLPSSLFLVAVFLQGEWGLTDFTWPGRCVCMFMCVAGIGLYAIPVGSLFDSFGAVIGMGEGDGDEGEEEQEEESEKEKMD